MEMVKFNRVIEIDTRIKNLKEVNKAISPKVCYRLSYVDSDNKGSLGLKMKYIGDLLDKHDEMIRAEIQQEIDRLNAEIETL